VECLRLVAENADHCVRAPLPRRIERERHRSLGRRATKNRRRRVRRDCPDTKYKGDRKRVGRDVARRSPQAGPSAQSTRPVFSR
jgi:hypothetical protein